jgi:hypothetical protein
VRTEIDRLEGRKRFLDNETSLGKISLSLTPLRPIVAATPSGFGVDVRHAATDAAELTAGIVTLGIRAAGVLVPISVLLGLPGVMFVLWLRRRQRKLAVAMSS